MSKRSIKIDGVTTSLFLEETFWNELENRAQESDTTWTQYLRTLLDEHDTSGNRSAAVKEILLAQLRDEYEELRREQDGIVSSYWLVEEWGKRERVMFQKNAISVGRDPSNDIIFDDVEVADKHLILVYDNQRWWAVDLNTKQGSKLNNKPIQTCVVPRRAELSVGSSQIIRV